MLNNAIQPMNTEKRLERNRITSKRCRERKKAKTQALKDRIKDLDALILKSEVELNNINGEIFILNTISLSLDKCKNVTFNV